MLLLLLLVLFLFYIFLGSLMLAEIIIIDFLSSGATIIKKGLNCRIIKLIGF